MFIHLNFIFRVIEFSAIWTAISLWRELRVALLGLVKTNQGQWEPYSREEGAAMFCHTSLQQLHCLRNKVANVCKMESKKWIVHLWCDTWRAHACLLGRHNEQLCPQHIWKDLSHLPNGRSRCLHKVDLWVAVFPVELPLLLLGPCFDKLESSLQVEKVLSSMQELNHYRITQGPVRRVFNWKNITLPW